MSTGRIDVHQHVVPPFWAEALPEHGGDPSGWASPNWTPENAIDFMDSQGIAMGVLSLTAPGDTSWSGAERRDIGTIRGRFMSTIHFDEFASRGVAASSSSNSSIRPARLPSPAR
jgi:hypothetical protein